MIGSVAGGASVLRDAREAAKSSAMPHALSPAEQAVVIVDFRNSRREGLHIYTSEELSKPRHSPRIPFPQDPRPKSVQRKNKIQKPISAQFVQVNLRSPRLGGLQRLLPGDLASGIRCGAGHHARKGGFGALVRLIVKITAGNASRSANSRFELKLPVTENACASAFSFAGEAVACQGSSPQMPSGPVYGDCEVPFVPKKRSVTSHQPLANCVELKVTSTPSG